MTSPPVAETTSHTVDGGGGTGGVTDGALPARPWRLDSPVHDGDPEAWRRIQRWSRDYLCQPHGELGRAGPVCPYMPSALAAGRVFAAVWPGRPAAASEVTAGLRGYLRWFERTCRDGHHALLLLFPGTDTSQVRCVVENTQRQLKTEFVTRGLMLGEFHNGPPAKRALHNQAFHPLRSPVPLLAIRDMVRGDLPFLLDDPRHRAAHAARFRS